MDLHSDELLEWVASPEEGELDRLLASYPGSRGAGEKRAVQSSKFILLPVRDYTKIKRKINKDNTIIILLRGT